VRYRDYVMVTLVLVCSMDNASGGLANGRICNLGKISGVRKWTTKTVLILLLGIVFTYEHTIKSNILENPYY
jgi:hypothetical protein